jgi:hypothetical protein
MEKRVVSDYIKDFVLKNFDKIEGLNGNRTEEFVQKFNTAIDENEDEIYYSMLETRKKINKEMMDKGECDENDFEDQLKKYSAIFLISRTYFYISYVGIFNEDDLNYPKFDEKTYYQFSSSVYIPYDCE